MESNVVEAAAVADGKRGWMAEDEAATAAAAEAVEETIVVAEVVADVADVADVDEETTTAAHD
jgi:hypothetical protein